MATATIKSTNLKKPTSFRLNTELLDILKNHAKACNRSLNNYVESLLMDVVYNEPNEETKKAIKEAKSGKRDPKDVFDSTESLMRSLMKL